MNFVRPIVESVCLQRRLGDVWSAFPSIESETRSSGSAMMVLATPMPKSWWKCASSRFLMRLCTWVTKYFMACGDSTPKVSTSASASMWPSLPTFSIRSSAHFNSAREKSIGKNTTSRPFCARRRSPRSRSRSPFPAASDRPITS